MKPESSLKQKKIIDENTVFETGKYEGLKARDLAKNKPGYIIALNQFSGMEVSSELLFIAIENLPEDYE